MDILKILTDSVDELYPEDLEFFETELNTGEYERAYIDQCREKLQQLRNWMENPEPQEEFTEVSEKIPGNIIVNPADLAPKEDKATALRFKPEELIFRDVTAFREQSAYKTRFKQYVREHTLIDADFLEHHYSFFTQWELDAVVSVRQLGEDFLEKYFGALSHEAIARYQIFSEAFYMKHFSQLDSEIVLLRGKNEWRKKENRSKQLDIFLRLKGVKI